MAAEEEHRAAEGGETERSSDATEIRRGSAMTTRTRALLAVLALVAVAAAVLLLGGGDSNTPTNGTGSGVLPQPDLAGVIDMFDRADGALGRAGSGDQWTFLNGEWRVVGGQAAVTEKPADRRATAVVDAGVTDGVLNVVVDVVRPQCGVILRMQGPVDYLALIAVPNLGTWNLVRVGMGGTTVIGNIGNAPVKDGARVEVELASTDVTVRVGSVERRFVVNELAAGTKVGLVCGGPIDTAGQARFGELVFLPRGVGSQSSAATNAAANNSAVGG